MPGCVAGGARLARGDSHDSVAASGLGVGRSVGRGTGDKMAQPAPDNWRGAMASARAEGPASRATSQPRNQERKPAAKGAVGRSATRSSSQPKQRGKAGAGKLPPVPPALSVHEARLAKQRKECEGKASEELEMQLQSLLQRGSFGDAAYLIEASEFLAAKYKTADVVRLMLETKQFERATQLIREMNMTSNQLLVTLLVKELVLASQFHAAVRVAQEMVQDFGRSAAEAAGAEQGRAGWTPLALVQAMIRAQHFRTALKFAKQFSLLDTFPVVPLVASMFETRAWADGVSSVMVSLCAGLGIDCLRSYATARPESDLLMTSSTCRNTGCSLSSHSTC